MGSTWVMCPKCSTSQNNTLVWKHSNPGKCWHCGSTTVPANHLRQQMLYGDERHGTQTGYATGCRLPCCQEAHAVRNAGQRPLSAVDKLWDRGPSERVLRSMRKPVTIDDIDDEFDN
jgi:hypothetical protein